MEPEGSLQFSQILPLAKILYHFNKDSHFHNLFLYNPF
jgi:hypothetical protein